MTFQKHTACPAEGSGGHHDWVEGVCAQCGLSGFEADPIFGHLVTRWETLRPRWVDLNDEQSAMDIDHGIQDAATREYATEEHYGDTVKLITAQLDQLEKILDAYDPPASVPAAPEIVDLFNDIMADAGIQLTHDGKLKG